MAVNPWGQPNEESIEGIMARAARQVKKTTVSAVKAVANDVKQQVTGNYGEKATEQGAVAAANNNPAQANQTGGKTGEQLAGAEEEKQKLLAQTRQNLEKINNDLKLIRQKKAKQEQESGRVEESKKEKKKQMEEKKKQEEPLWKKMLRSGSHEMIKNAGG